MQHLIALVFDFSSWLQGAFGLLAASQDVPFIL